MSDSRLNDEISLWQLIRRWWWVMLLAAFIAGVAGYGVATKLPKTYQSTVTMLVGPINTDLALDASGSLTATYESLATSQPVLQAAIAATHTHITAGRLLGSVTTTSNTVSRLVTISVSNPDPVRAARLANTMAARVSKLANTTPEAANAATAAFDQEPEVQALTNVQRSGVEDALRRVIGVSPAGEVTVVNPALPATSAASPRKSLIAALAALAGVAIATLALLFRMSGKRTAADERSLAELEHTYLGVVDISQARDAAAAVSVEARPNSSAAADYRMLAARLSLAESMTRSLLVVDSSDGSAAGVVAANLASALSHATDKSVVLADVSTDPGGATKLLGLEGREGYAELIAAADLETLNGSRSELFVDRGDQVSVLPRGIGEATKTLSTERAGALLRRLQDTADLVVLSGPSMTRSPAGLIWARATETVLFVVDGNKASRDEVMQAISDLTLANGRFFGTVIGRRRLVLPVLSRGGASRETRLTDNSETLQPEIGTALWEAANWPGHGENG